MTIIFQALIERSIITEGEDGPIMFPTWQFLKLGGAIGWDNPSTSWLPVVNGGFCRPHLRLMGISPVASHSPFHILLI